MAQFNRGETIICSVLVKNSAGTLVDPQTSMKITIKDANNGAEVNNVDMTKTATGTYHYDFNSTASSMKGLYTVLYKATDGTRISICQDSFELT